MTRVAAMFGVVSGFLQGPVTCCAVERSAVPAGCAEPFGAQLRWVGLVCLPASLGQLA